MATPLSNERKNPFTSAVSFRTMDTEVRTVAQFNELPGLFGVRTQDSIEIGSITVVENVTGGAEFVIVNQTPSSSGQVQIAHSIGLLLFHPDDDGKEFNIDYEGGGSIDSIANHLELTGPTTGGPNTRELWVDPGHPLATATGDDGIFDTIANAFDDATNGIASKTLGDQNKFVVQVFSVVDASTFTVPKYVIMRSSASLKTVLTGTMNIGGAPTGLDDFHNIPLVEGFVFDGTTINSTNFCVIRDCSAHSGALLTVSGGICSIFQCNWLGADATVTGSAELVAVRATFNSSTLIFNSTAESKFKLSELEACTIAGTGSGGLQLVNGEMKSCSTADLVTVNIETVASLIQTCIFDGQHDVTFSGGSMDTLTLNVNYDGTATFNNVAKIAGGTDNGAGVRTFTAEMVAIA